jgi:NADH-quinone oxidoreductase subunit J
MNFAFYLSAAVAVFATGMVITRKHPVHALLYLILSLIAVAMVFFTLGAELVALLEVIVYAGAIIVLFVFMIMMLNLGPPGIKQEGRYIPPRIWVGPVTLAALLVIEFIYVLAKGGHHITSGGVVSAKQVGITMYETYFLAVELASMILLAGLVAAYHLGKRELPDEAGEGEA